MAQHEVLGPETEGVLGKGLVLSNFCQLSARHDSSKKFLFGAVFSMEETRQKAWAAWASSPISTPLSGLT